jgi:hypothetical protein
MGGDFRFWPILLKKSLLAKNPIFSEALVRSWKKLCEGPHVHADFRPAGVVARLQGILLLNTGRDGSVANFFFNYIFEFFNRIGPSRHFGAARQFGCFRTEADIGPDFMSTRPTSRR